MSAAADSKNEKTTSSGGAASKVNAEQAVILGPMRAGFSEILSKEAITFLVALHRKFENTRQALLAAREKRQTEIDAGVFPNFLNETAWIRAGTWKACAPAKDLTDRRVEITGPVDAKMVINALNAGAAGARVFMADFEDSTSPVWANLITGQINLRAAVNRTLSYEDKTSGKRYALGQKLATLMVRPRGWHLPELHLTIDGQPISGSLFDFGLYFFHNAKSLLKRGSGPYFYLPKMESHLEARLWNDVFNFAQSYVGIPQGTIRATVLIETILASFEMDEIIWELRDHSAGLNCGRWDYIFSFIKKFRSHAHAVLPDRAQVTMTAPWMASYVKLLIQTCHKRGVHAMGGMAAQIPVKDDAKANAAAFDKVKGDKLREVKAGCDGTWVAHPGLVEVAVKVFDEYMPQPNQIGFVGDASSVSAKDLLYIGKSEGGISEPGLRANVSVGLAYLEAWLRGNGCVPLHNLMEDAATAEISRCQIWQWIKHSAKLKDGRVISKGLASQMLDEEVATLKSVLGEGYAKRKFELATSIYRKMLLSDGLADFLTLSAYPYILTVAPASKL